MSRRTRADERAAVLEKARELARTEPSPDWTEEEWRKLMAAAVSQELERRPAGRKAFPQPLLAYGSAALFLVVAAGIALRLGVFRPSAPAPLEAPAPVLAQKSAAAPPSSNEADAREKETVLAELPSAPRKGEGFAVGGIMAPSGRIDAKDDARGPDEAARVTDTKRPASPDPELRIVWALDRDFEWRGGTLSAIQEIDVKPADLLFTVQLVLGSESGEARTDEALKNDKVIAELRSLFRYVSYALLGQNVVRTLDQRDAEIIIGKAPQFVIQFRDPKIIKNGADSLIESEVRLVRLEPAAAQAGGETAADTILVQTSLSMKPGERTVIGVSRLNGGDKALVLIITGKVIG